MPHDPLDQLSLDNFDALVNAAAGPVWIIDDDVAVRALFESLFTREGLTVVISDSVGSALKQLPHTLDFSLALLDINLPGGTGFDVLRELRKVSDAPVVMCSNLKRPDAVEQAFALGATDFVEKPFDPRSLLARVRRLVH